MAVAIAVAVVMEQYGVEVQTKWPNDLLIKKRKICGILAERFQMDAIVVGIGINVNMCREDADQIDPPATSLLIETGQRFIVEELFGVVVRIAPINQLRFYQPFDRCPRVVDPVFKRFSNARTEHINPIKAGSAVFVDPHLRGETL